MKPYPDVTSVVEAVCGSLNSVSSDLGLHKGSGTIPVNAQDILYEPSKYRTHSDVRVLTAMILRKHILLPYGYGEHKQPTIEWICQQLFGRGRNGGIVFRMANMCEIMQRDDRYRKVYLRAISKLLQKDFELFNLPKDLAEASPC